MGPLAPAVYWRRRAAVFGALALLVSLAAVGWNHLTGADDLTGTISRARGPGDDASRGPGASTRSAGGHGGAPPTPGASAAPGGAGAAPGGAGAAPGGAGAAPGGAVLAPDSPPPPCSDADVALSADVEPSPGVYGGTFSLGLVVHNVTDHECVRDIGSGPQEVRVVQGETTLWSSDDCGTPQESDVRLFPAGVAVRYAVQWSSYRRAPDACRVAAEPAPPGTYQVVARLGDKLSDPAPFEIRR